VRSWRTHRRSILFEHQIFRLERHELEEDIADPIARRESLVLEAPDWVNVIPRLDDGRILLVRQWRFGIGRPTLEIPGGMIDAGEDAVQAAARELLEETGYRAGALCMLGETEPNPAFLTNRCTSFLATGLGQVGEPEGDGEEELEVVAVAPGQIPLLIAQGEIRHALVIAAFYWLGLREGRAADARS
jgi:8-oxo-dGTP pyrophosphatase MutT (NUDIX family)